MKKNFLASLFFGRHALKIFALVVGYSFWLAIAYHQQMQHEINMPVNVYRTDGTLACRTSTCVHVIGPRHLILDALEVTTPINVRQINDATTVVIEPEALVLPAELDITDYTPSTITITPTIKKDTAQSPLIGESKAIEPASEPE